jgi:hypothetical protein
VRSAEERGIQGAAPNSSGGGTKINLVSVNIDKSDGSDLRLAETYLARHRRRHESASPE